MDTTQITERYKAVREVGGDITSAVGASGRAYANGVVELGKALFGFGREAYEEVVDNVRATANAKCMREVAELQAAFIQTRIENSTAHMKEFADLARVKAEETVEPLVGLVKKEAAAGEAA